MDNPSLASALDRCGAAIRSSELHAGEPTHAAVGTILAGDRPGGGFSLHRGGSLDNGVKPCHGPPGFLRVDKVGGTTSVRWIGPSDIEAMAADDAARSAGLLA